MGSSRSYKAGHTGKGRTVPADNSKMGSGESHSAKGRSANKGMHDARPVCSKGKKGMKY
jgi:hypothetical protein